MNTNAASQADQQRAPDSSERWSTAHDLLVWTVSRIDGGRRHGVEPDCHVVYGLSRGYFVEQTRKFRASAEQCIEMLQQGKRAGTTQRKIALDSIVAIRSDARTGRLQIRTLNGTHQLDPVSYDEADVLRQIAIELELRMPPGGAEFTPLQDSGIADSRIDAAAEERRALVSLENARAEDIPDNYREPEYRPPVDQGAPVAAGVEPPTTTGTHFTEEELERLAATLDVEVEPVDPDLPADITVAGGVEITYDPTPVSELALAGEALVEAAQHSAEAPSAEIDAASVEEASWVAPTESRDDSPIYMSEHAAQSGEADLAPISSPPVAAVAEEQQVVAADEEYEVSDRFERALRHRIDTVSPVPESLPQPANEPIEAVSPVPESLPQPANEPIEAVSPVPEPLPQPANEPIEAVPSSVFAAPEAAPEGSTTDVPAAADPAMPSEDRRQVEDTSFPSVFDRRGTGPARGPARFGDDLPVDHSVSHHVPGHHGDGEDNETDEPDLPSAPPTIAAPTGPSAAGAGGAVGFNPDFDVNPFR